MSVPRDFIPAVQLVTKPRDRPIKATTAAMPRNGSRPSRKAATAISSLAQANLRTGDPVAAEEHARHALRLLGTRVDRLDEIGNARLVLGRALLEQGRLEEAEATLAEAEDAFAQLSSGSHRAAAWVAQGDLAQRRGDDAGAATLYRRAAETLQDFRF